MSESDRARARGKVSLSGLRLSVTLEFRKKFGSDATFIPVLPDDTVAYLLKWLQEATNPVVALAYLDDDGTPQFITLTRVDLTRGDKGCNGTAF